MPPCVQYDDLWPGGPRFARSGAGFALGTDSVLLADFAADRRVRRFADLGCGAGVLTVLLLHALPQAAAVGVELQPDAAQLCRNNLEANGLTGRAQILCADLREHRAVLPAGSFDLVVANPPYFAAGSGYTGLEPKRLRTVAHTAHAAPSLVLVEARRGGKPGLKLLPPLALCAPDGTDSEEIRRIYHRRT